MSASDPRYRTSGAVFASRPAGAAGRAFRIALLAHVRHPVAPPFAGGMEAHTHALARALAARGHAVTLLASGDSDAPPGVALEPIVPEHYERRLPWARHHGRARLGRHLDAVYARACEAIEVGRFDVVHNNTLHPSPIERARRAGWPMVTSLHVPPFPALRRAIDARAAPTLRYTVTSERQRAIWWPAAVPREARVVHNGIDLDAWPYRDAGDGSAIWAGRITPNKGTALAIDAARRAGVALSLVGPIEDRDHFAAEIAPRLGGSVRYAGHLEREALADRFGRASLGLFTPLWEEPFGLVAIEAMACGLPLACTDRGAAREVVGSAGAFASRAGVAALAEAIVAARRLPRARARARVERRFTLERMVDGYERLYGECLAAAARARRPEPRTAARAAPAPRGVGHDRAPPRAPSRGAALAEGSS